MANSAFYDYRIILPICVWQNEDYTRDRRARLITLQCCMRHWRPFRQLHEDKQNEYILRIEMSGYNSACNKADEYHVPKNWDKDNTFVNIYISY